MKHRVLVDLLKSQQFTESISVHLLNHFEWKNFQFILESLKVLHSFSLLASSFGRMILNALRTIPPYRKAVNSICETIEVS